MALAHVCPIFIYLRCSTFKNLGFSAVCVAVSCFSLKNVVTLLSDLS